MKKLVIIAILAIISCGASMAQSTKMKILPYKVEKNEVEQMFKKWADEKHMAPNDLKDATINSVEQIYMPYIVVSANTKANYKGESGYESTEKVRNNYGEYKEERVTKWRNKSGTVSKNQINVLASGFPDSTQHSAERVEPWDFDDAVPFSADKLEPYPHYVYDPEQSVLSKSVIDALKEGISENIKKDLGGSSQRINSIDLEYEDLEMYYIYLPLYAIRYTYDDKEYQIVMNGQTGKGDGDAPQSGFKLFLSLLCGGSIVGALTLLIKGFGGKKKS